MRLRLGEVLLESGAITLEQLNAALAEQAAEPRSVRRRLGRVLVDQGTITDVTLAAALADRHGLHSVDLTAEQIDPTIARHLPQSTAQNNMVLPLRLHNGILRIAVGDPVDVVAVDELRVRLPGVRLDVVVAPEGQLREVLSRIWRTARSDDLLAQMTEEAAGEQDDADAAAATMESMPAAVAAVEQVLATAVASGASDIHLEPGTDEVLVRMRIDGQLTTTMSLPKSSHAAMVSRIKILSNLDVIERRLPQDGRARLVVDGAHRNMRISTLPSLRGEKVVIRLLADRAELPSLDGLGMSDQQAGLLRDVLHRPQGLVLVTGPTGSGKTTTMYAALKETLDSARNLITLEDPVEVELPGATQVQIDDRIGLTFPAGLRSALRQDPDVILVGEIRDQQTAELAVRAALTGHLVVSTLHTLDAPSAVLRLTDMGVPRYLVGASLSLALAQRLVRRPCASCVAPAQVDPDTIARLKLGEREARRMVAGAGCRRCGGSGYSGRVGIYEMLPVDSAVRVAIAEADEEELFRQARTAGWAPMREVGVASALAGLTTPAELLRVL